MYVGRKNPRCGCNHRPHESLIASAGPSGQQSLGLANLPPLQRLEDARRFQTARGYGSWRISDAAFGRMSICVHSEASRTRACPPMLCPYKTFQRDEPPRFRSLHMSGTTSSVGRQQHIRTFSHPEMWNGDLTASQVWWHRHAAQIGRVMEAPRENGLWSRVKLHRATPTCTVLLGSAC